MEPRITIPGDVQLALFGLTVRDAIVESGWKMPTEDSEDA